MKRNIAALLVMMVLSGAGCDTSKTQDQQTNPSVQTETVATALPAAAEVSTGAYVGYFVAAAMNDAKSPQSPLPMYRNKINLSIDAMQDDKISGHSVVAGNHRPFVGSYAETKPGEFEVEAKEPGDDQYDGTFHFTLKGNQLVGNWTANDKNLPVPTRSYDLKKTTFTYNPQLEFGAESYEIYNSFNANKNKSEFITGDAATLNASTTLLTTADVENMYKRDLEVIRNTIYARHGYSFQNREMRKFFDNLSWYIPVSTDVTRDLTSLEKQNVELLKRYEKHAATYYDNFGR